VTLDPRDWPAFRKLAHEALDAAIDYVEHIRERPVWQPIPDELRAALRSEPMPTEPTPLAAVVEEFRETILPYATGNVHPRFYGWVHGSGTPSGIVADLLASAMNANVGGRDHGAVEIERQVLRWCCDLFGFPPEASGLLVTGTSLANALGIAVARGATGGTERRAVYASATAHNSIDKALRLCGYPSGTLRKIPVDEFDRIDLAGLDAQIAIDRAAGVVPAIIVASAGTVDAGAFDDLQALADRRDAHDMWLHVDGAFGALVILAPTLRDRLAGIDRVDSLAFDFHKWMHVPYDAGALLVRDGAKHRAAFATAASYLKSTARGIAGGAPWFTDFGIDLSRGFRALKIWFAIKEFGTKQIGALIEENCAQAARLGERIAASEVCELSLPVQLNIVCFRYRPPGLGGPALDELNEAIALDLAESGIAVVSTTAVGGRRVLRVNLTNHRTTDADIAQTFAAICKSGARLASAGVP